MISYKLSDSNIIYIELTGKIFVGDIEKYLDEFKSVND